MSDDLVTDRALNTSVLVQAHVSFRRCVGQSAAEFVIHLLAGQAAGSVDAGVYLPETLAAQAGTRSKLLDRLTSTPGTIVYRVQPTTPPDAGSLKSSKVMSDVA